MNRPSGFFITGTDTNIGKTWAAIALMRALQLRGNRAFGMKPVAAGCEWRQGGWKNQDAVWLQQYSSVAVDYDRINPYAFERPISPHIACGEVYVDPDVILSAFEYLKARSDCVVVEGAGGWFSPLGRDLDNALLAKTLQLPVVLVVGMRLGCINHARLSYQAIRQAGLEVFGWLAVQLEPEMPEFEANLAYLNNSMHARFLGVLPYLSEPDFDLLAEHVNF
ncbi:MAG: dethiobiotin synthase [Methylomonas sp.]|nr:dethiobiotin synthase [Methylomonas sp.]